MALTQHLVGKNLKEEGFTLAPWFIMTVSTTGKGSAGVTLWCLDHTFLEQEAKRLGRQWGWLLYSPWSLPSSSSFPPAGSYLQKIDSSPLYMRPQLGRKHSNTGAAGHILYANHHKAFGRSSLWPAATLFLVFFWAKNTPSFRSQSSRRSLNLTLLSLTFSKTCTYFFFHNIYFDLYIFLFYSYLPHVFRPWKWGKHICALIDLWYTTYHV